MSSISTSYNTTDMLSTASLLATSSVAYTANTSNTANTATAINTEHKRDMLSTLNASGRLNSTDMLSLRSSLNSPHRLDRSQYLYDVERRWLPPKSPNPPQDVVVPGHGHLETDYNYANINGWVDDIPVMFTVMSAKKTYEQANLLFSSRSKRLDNTTTNRWIM